MAITPLRRGMKLSVAGFMFCSTFYLPESGKMIKFVAYSRTGAPLGIIEVPMV